MLLVDALQETRVALLEANRACEIAETRVAHFKALLEQTRAECDHWREQARLLEEVRADRNYWREQAQRPALPWWKRAIATEWSSQKLFLGSLS